DGLVFKRGSSVLSVPLVPGNRKAFVEVWGSHLEALEYDDAVSRWFSESIGVQCRLVMMLEGERRKVNPEYAWRPGEDVVSFAVAMPLLLIGESSLGDLNERITAANDLPPRPTATPSIQDGSLEDLPPRPTATPPIQEGSFGKPLTMRRFR